MLVSNRRSDYLRPVAGWLRITAPGVKEAEMLGEIHRRLRERGYTTPISADIHFVAEAASVAARYVEKVRINPGNFADKRPLLRS